MIQLDIELVDLGVGLAEKPHQEAGMEAAVSVAVDMGAAAGSEIWSSLLRMVRRRFTSIDSDDRISGDANQAVYRIALPLDASHQPGEWTLSALTLNVPLATPPTFSVNTDLVPGTIRHSAAAGASGLKT